MGAKLEDDEEEATDVGPPMKYVAPCVACAGQGTLLTSFGAEIVRRRCAACRGIGSHFVLLVSGDRRRPAL
jgi:hypothetical protein